MILQIAHLLLFNHLLLFLQQLRFPLLFQLSLSL